MTYHFLTADGRYTTDFYKSNCYKKTATQDGLFIFVDRDGNWYENVDLSVRNDSSLHTILYLVKPDPDDPTKRIKSVIGRLINRIDGCEVRSPWLENKIKEIASR